MANKIQFVPILNAKKLAGSLMILLSLGIQGNAWQKPVARMQNPKFPMQVQVVNQTEYQLDCDLTDISPDTVPQTLPANEKLNLSLEDVEVNISVSHTDQNLPDTSPHYFQFEFVPNSEDSLTVIVNQAAGPDLLGDDMGQVIDIQQSGAIFVY